MIPKFYFRKWKESELHDQFGKIIFLCQDIIIFCNESCKIFYFGKTNELLQHTATATTTTTRGVSDVGFSIFADADFAF